MQPKFKHYVRHRIDGLEILSPLNTLFMQVRHRIDGLEKHFQAHNHSIVVRHRIDGLENSTMGMSLCH